MRINFLLFFIVSLFITSSCTIYEPTTSGTVESIDNTEIFYASRGKSSDVTLLFIHCWTCDNTFWSKQFDYFSKGYQTVVLDLAGHGVSKTQRQHFTMQAFAKDIAAVVNDSLLNIKKVILIGHSMGGPIAIETAKLLGDKVIGIVAVDSFYTNYEFPKDDATIEAFIAPFKTDYQAESTKLVESMFHPNADPRTKAAIIKTMTSANPAMGIDALHEIFIWNKHRDAHLQFFQEKLYHINASKGDAYPDTHMLLIPDAGHFIPQTNADEFNQALDKILKSILATP